MNRKQRVIFSDNGTLKDISYSVNDYKSAAYVLPIVATEDKIYIGTELPFNHRHIEVTVANDAASAMSFEFWNGSAWTAAVDQTDETMIPPAGACLAQSGIVQFTPDINKSSWLAQRDTNSNPAQNLQPLRIFDLFWSRITFSHDLNVATAIKYIGQRFSTDSDLISFYPDLASAQIKAAFASGKTDWKDQSFAAAENIVSDLRARNIVIRGFQIMDPSLFNMPSVHKTAAIIYRGLGNAYIDRAKNADAEYKASLSMGYFEVDTDADGAADVVEKTHSTRYMTR